MKTGLLILFFIISCNKQNQDSKKKLLSNNNQELIIDKVYLYNIAGYVENPNNQIQNLVSTVIQNELVYKVNEKYNGKKLVSSDTIKTIKKSSNVKNIISNIPNKYLMSDQKFGETNVADEGSLGVTIFIKGGKEIFWELSYNENTLPKDIEPFYKMFKNVQDEMMK